VFTRTDRPKRSLRDLQNTVHDFRQRGVALKATEQPIDTSTAAGKCFLDMLGVFAEFETNLRRERQMEVIARAKVNGVYADKGRPASIDAARVHEMKAQEDGRYRDRQSARHPSGERLSAARRRCMMRRPLDGQSRPVGGVQGGTGRDQHTAGMGGMV
jgi:DNA invertase Pin-like site-specific DNA recombinase